MKTPLSSKRRETFQRTALDASNEPLKKKRGKSGAESRIQKKTIELYDPQNGSDPFLTEASSLEKGPR